MCLALSTNKPFFEMKHPQPLSYSLSPDSRELVIDFGQTFGKMYFTFVDTLSKGSFGQIVSYKSKSIPWMFGVGVKFFLGDNKRKISSYLSEKKVIDKLKSIPDCYIFYTSSIYNDYNLTIVMPLFSGSLHSVIANPTKFRILKFSEIIKIIQHLVKGLICLSKYNMYYTDLKPDNILVEYDNGDYKNVVFGDLGSFCYADNPQCIVTYSSPDMIYLSLDKPNEIIKLIVWCMSLVFILCVCTEYNKISNLFSYGSMKKLQKEKTPQELHQLIQYELSIFKIKNEYLYETPKIRTICKQSFDSTTLEQLLYVFQQY